MTLEQAVFWKKNETKMTKNDPFLAIGFSNYHYRATQALDSSLFQIFVDLLQKPFIGFSKNEKGS